MRQYEHAQLHMYSVSQKNPPRFSDIFSKRLGIFSSNFIRLLYVLIYARLPIFIQLPATLTKLCHIKRDHPVHIMCAKCPPSAKTHFLRLEAGSLIKAGGPLQAGGRS